MSVGYDQAFWDERYRQHAHIWSGNPNPHLVAQAEDLRPGRALDVGCGEGADAVWLAQRGWQVDAIDVSEVALNRAREHAGAQGDRVTFRRVDLMTERDLGDARYDLVSSQYLHLPPDVRTAVIASLATATARGGTLLIVGHHVSDLQVVPRPNAPELFFTGAEIRAALVADEWDVLIDTAAPRTVPHPEDGRTVTIHDNVFCAVRR
ncbi:class I SAM-dependent methyltransferase [uncultured Jatrophihabitans sp.]|uniref:class I SAM-dependent methyltransferase n=1 Tax=uncultured Jatrophihabitans sp. TaxID=1610747 RepID=UPI0035C9D725